ncbi:MAG: OmpA family protein [Kofleriaceae bacterium]|nr:OmpA family protein [Kofleriaceae bacterium]
MTTRSKTPTSDSFASLILSVLVALASIALTGCISEEPEFGHRQEAIIECNGGSIGQACDTDDDLCTQEICVLVGQSVSCELQSFAPDDTACSSDGLPCTADLCMEGVCSHSALAAGTLCDDGLFCTEGDFCSESGVCGGGAGTCDDSNDCTSDSCDESANSCNNAITPGASCNDGDACTSLESCSKSGVCEGSVTTICDDSSSCTSDSCDAVLGCVFTIMPEAACGDSFFCTVAESCATDGTCQGVANCNDNNSCTLDSCDELAESCTNQIIPGQNCEDGNECTTSDICDALGGCVGANAPDGMSCGAAGGCLIGGSCQGGSCSATMAEPDNTLCDDNDACTVSDSCFGGNCNGYPVSCNDNDPCTADGCDSLSGCFYDIIEGCQTPPDAGMQDAGTMSDAGIPDAGAGDAGTGDSGTGSDAATGVLGGGGCNSSGAGATSLWFLLLLALGLRRLRRSRIASLSLLLAALLYSPTAHADGFNSELFKPGTSNTSFFSQSSAEILPSASYHLNLGLNLSTSPLVLRDPDSGAEIPGGEIVSQRTGAYLSGGLGLYSRYELGFALPLVLSQDGSGMMLLGNPDLNAASLGDARFEAKARIWSTASLSVAAQLTTTLPIGNDKALLGDPSPTIAPRIVLSVHRGRVHVGANMGVRIRTRNEVADLAVDDELVAGAGINVEVMPSKLWILAEAYANRGMHTSQAEAFPAEAIAGVRYSLLGPWQMQAGIGSGVGRGYGTPSFRGLLSFSYAPKAMVPPEPSPIVPVVKVTPKPKPVEKAPPVDVDGDGILPPVDQCPEEAEDMDGFEDEDGCPDNDNDNDGIADSEDDCPDEPETLNGVDDQDGCPDEGLITMKVNRIVLDDTVLFDQNRARVKRLGKKALRAIAVLYKQHPEWGVIKISGHSDSHGPRDYNLELSRRRASRVRDELILLGIDGAVISTEGFGESKLLHRGKGDSSSKKNRRVEFIIEVPTAP